MTTFEGKKLTTAHFFLATRIFECVRIFSWPEKVGNWPVLKVKVASKSDKKSPARSVCVHTIGQMATFFILFKKKKKK